MKIAIMGAGAVGGYYGARLAQAGYDVTFIARGNHLAAMQEKGLTIDSELGSIYLEKPKATDNPSSLSPVDVILFCVKLWDTQKAAEAIKPLLKSDTMVISLQNGIEKDDILKSILGENYVVGGITYILSTIGAPGLIKQVGKESLIFGEYNLTQSKRAESFLEACLQAGINVHLSNNILKDIWEKFVFLVGFSGTTSAMRSAIGKIRANPNTRAFLLDCMQEVIDVGLAKGVDLGRDFAKEKLEFCDRLPENSLSSMAADLQRGNRLEVSWLSGAVVVLGTKLGIPTPVNRAIYDVLILHAE